MPYRTTPQVEERKAIVRGRIVWAARKLFAEQGYEATSVQQIVREAGTSVGNCYFYFPNKEAILVAAAQQLLGELLANIDQAVTSAGTAPHLRIAAATYTTVVDLLRNAQLLRPGSSDDASSLLDRVTARIERLIEEHARPRGKTDQRLAALAWRGSLSSVLQAGSASAEQSDVDSLACFLVRWNLQALGFSKKDGEAALAYLASVDLSSSKRNTHNS